jgi:hypothetical protein
MNIEPSVPGNRKCSRQAAAAGLAPGLPQGHDDEFVCVWEGKKNLYMLSTVVGRFPFRLQANFAMTRQSTASDLLGHINLYLLNAL